ncbi:MAG: hypothetical protein KDB03_27875, partial [Planctomycetales bacterium]|nr:hypothetical protein [Planctomycetales bacterium]
ALTLRVTNRPQDFANRLFITLLVRVARTYSVCFQEIVDQMGKSTLLLCEVFSRSTNALG